MENFFLDNEDILFHLDHIDLDRVIAYKEDSFQEAKKYQQSNYLLQSVKS